MSCEEFEAVVVGLARGENNAEAEQHIRGCQRCQARLAAERALATSFHALRERQSLEGPSSAVQQALAAELRRRSRTRTAPWAWAAAAVALLALAWGLWPAQEPPVIAERSRPFLVLDYSRPITAADRGRLVRVRLPGTAPTMVGLPAAASASVEADLLLGEDGSARAIRFVGYSEDY